MALQIPPINITAAPNLMEMANVDPALVNSVRVMGTRQPQALPPSITGGDVSGGGGGGSSGGLRRGGAGGGLDLAALAQQLGINSPLDIKATKSSGTGSGATDPYAAGLSTVNGMKAFNPAQAKYQLDSADNQKKGAESEFEQQKLAAKQAVINAPDDIRSTLQDTYLQNYEPKIWQENKKTQQEMTTNAIKQQQALEDLSKSQDEHSDAKLAGIADTLHQVMSEEDPAKRQVIWDAWGKKSVQSAGLDPKKFPIPDDVNQVAPLAHMAIEKQLNKMKEGADRNAALANSPTFEGATPGIIPSMLNRLGITGGNSPLSNMSLGPQNTAPQGPQAGSIAPIAPQGQPAQMGQGTSPMPPGVPAPVPVQPTQAPPNPGAITVKGRSFTTQDIEHTAKQSGLTPQQVIQHLQSIGDK